MLSKTQLDYLRSVIVHGGGSAKIEGHAVRIGEYKTPAAAAISFLNLIADGCIEARRDRTLVATDRGRAMLNPFHKPASAQETLPAHEHEFIVEALGVPAKCWCGVLARDVQAVCDRAAHLADVPVKETPAPPSLVNVEVIWDCASRDHRSKWAEDAGLLRVSAFARDLPWWSALPSDEWRARLVPHVRLTANRGEDR